MGILSRLVENAKENFTGVVKDTDWTIVEMGPDDIDEGLNGIIGVEVPITRSQAQAIVRWAMAMRDMPGIDEDPEYDWLWEMDEWDHYDYQGHLEEIFADELFVNLHKTIRENTMDNRKKTRYRSKYSLSDIFK